jgi:hypothetical protein
MGLCLGPAERLQLRMIFRNALLLRKRNKAGTIRDVLFPLYFMGIIMALAYIIPNTVIGDKLDNTISPFQVEKAIPASAWPEVGWTPCNENTPSAVKEIRDHAKVRVNTQRLASLTAPPPPKARFEWFQNQSGNTGTAKFTCFNDSALMSAYAASTGRDTLFAGIRAFNYTSHCCMCVSRLTPARPPPPPTRARARTHARTHASARQRSTKRL